jgi:hypothetical protein
MARSEIRIGSRDIVACMAEMPQPSPLPRSGQCLPGQTLTTPTVALDRHNPCSPLLTPLS